MKKVMIILLTVFLLSCEKCPPIEGELKIIPLDSIDWEQMKRRLWLQNDSVLLVFDNNTK